MNLKVDPSIMLLAFGPNGEEHRAFLGRLLLDNEPGINPVLGLCVDWDGRDVRRGTLYQEYLVSLRRVRGGQRRFSGWWGKLAEKHAIVPVVAPVDPVVKTRYPGWREHEYMLIGLAQMDRGKEHAVVAEFVPGYGPTYFQQDTLQRLENEDPPVCVLDIKAANKLIQRALLTGSGESVTADKGGAMSITLDTSTRVLLLGRIMDYFTKGELVHELCDPLDIKYEDVWTDADTLRDAVRELVAHCERRLIIRELVSQCQKARPRARWPQFSI